jgi:hypothetical protein
MRFEAMSIEEATCSAPVQEEPLQLEEPPPHLTCPITHELMVDPVATSDGQLYERRAIEQWLQDHETSPLSGAALSSRMLIPIVMIRDLCREWREARGVAVA